MQSLPDSFEQVNSVYFVRNKRGHIPVPKAADEANSVLPKWLEIGYFSGQALLMLEQAISEVYLPLLCSTNFGNEEKEGVKADFVVTMQKFASQISHTCQQIAGETRLQIPDDILSLDLRSENETRDPEVVKKLEALAEEWIFTIVGALAKESKKIPIGNVSF